jgi:hypothetical protein
MDRFEEGLALSLRRSMEPEVGAGVDVSAARVAVAGKVVRRAYRRKMMTSSAVVAVLAGVVVAGPLRLSGGGSSPEVAGGDVQVASVEVADPSPEGVAVNKDAAPAPLADPAPAAALGDPADASVLVLPDEGSLVSDGSVVDVAGSGVVDSETQPVLVLPWDELRLAGVVVLASSGSSAMLSVPTAQGDVVVEVHAVGSLSSVPDVSPMLPPQVVVRDANGVDPVLVGEAVAVVVALFD